jgi:hypothetical protein
MCSSILSVTSTVCGVGDQHHAPAALSLPTVTLPRLEKNTTIDPKEIGWETDWIYLTQNRDKWMTR